MSEEKKKTYVTFGQVHTHRVNGITFDADCVAVIESADYASGRERAVELFGPKFCTSYFDEEFEHDKMLSYFPRGLVPVK